MDIYEILSWWHAGYTISAIGAALGIDRETVRRYVREAEGEGVSKDRPLPVREALLELIVPLVPAKTRQMPARSRFDLYREEIVELVTRTTDSLKPKAAVEVICYRHGVEASYSSFKRFIRQLEAEHKGHGTTCGIEVDPGDEIQIDYGYVDRLPDQEAGRRRKVYVFAATLSHSRDKVLEFVFAQDQRSFVVSHVLMFAFFGGVPRKMTRFALARDMMYTISDPLFYARPHREIAR